MERARHNLPRNSPAHLAGCPVSALAGDLARSDKRTRAVATRIIRDNIELLATLIRDANKTDRSAITSFGRGVTGHPLRFQKDGDRQGSVLRRVSDTGRPVALGERENRSGKQQRVGEVVDPLHLDSDPRLR